MPGPSFPLTLPPIEVDPTDKSRQPANEINPMMGQFGSDLYLALANSQVVMTPRVGVYLSTDSGATWVEQDSAHAPSGASNFTTFFDIPNGLIHVFVNGQVISVFDTVPKTWGSPGTSTSLTNSNFFYRKSTGDYVVVGDTSGTHIAYSTNIAGVWAGPTSLISSNGAIKGGVRDGVDATHIGYFQSGAIKYFRLDASFSVSTPVTLLASGADNDRQTLCLFGTDSVAIAYDNGQTTYVSIGTPLSNPVFTQYVIQTVTGSAGVSYPTIVVDKDGNLCVFWVVVDQGTDPIVDEIRFSQFDGVSTWSTAKVFYDEVANPPADSADQTLQFLHTGQALMLADGTWVYSTAMETGVGGADTFCTGFILLDPPTSPTGTLELSKIVVGGPAVPGDWNLSAETGSPPTGISGAGHVGPSEVAAATYELAESGPSGEIWGDATWGEATWGGNYTPGSWDCGGATMPTPTSVVVPPGVDVACQIVNTFIPTPPPPPPPIGPGANAVGCFELIRLDVTLMPARHLPVRGSVK